MDKPEVERANREHTACRGINSSQIAGGWATDDPTRYIVGASFNDGPLMVWDSPKDALVFAQQLAIFAITAEVRSQSMDTLVVVDQDVPPMERTQMFVDEVCTSAMESLNA